MNSKLLIPVCIFIAFQFAYDLYGVPFNTRWSILYFSSQYISWLVLIVLLTKWRGFFKSRIFKKNLPYLSLGSGFIIYVIMEFSCWNMSWENYYAIINEFKKYILPIAVILTGITYYFIRNER